MITGTPCITGGTVSGTVTGSKISFGVVSGETQIVYDGSISGTTMQGTYVAPARCGDAKGSWTASKA